MDVVYTETGRYAEAEPLLRRAVDLRPSALGNDHPDVADVLDDYGRLLVAMGRGEDGARLRTEATQIRERHRLAEGATTAALKPGGDVP